MLIRLLTQLVLLTFLNGIVWMPLFYVASQFPPNAYTAPQRVHVRVGEQDYRLRDDSPFLWHGFATCGRKIIEGSRVHEIQVPC